MNDERMAISEVGAAYADYTFGKESRKGIPFTYLLRDVLQFDQSLDDSKFRMENANRTCNLILGVGDGKNEIFNSVRYSHSVADFFDDENMEPGPICTQPQPCDWHPRIDSVVITGWTGTALLILKDLDKRSKNIGEKLLQKSSFLISP